ncbi:MAG: hypothetical protein WCA04_14085 [Geobacteraceae bacterium]
MRIMLMSVFCALLFSTPLMAADSSEQPFCTLDKNHDNCLSKNEFLGGNVKIDKKKTLKLFPDLRKAEQLNDRAFKERLFERMDKNNDGLLSRDEWIHILPNILQISF